MLLHVLQLNGCYTAMAGECLLNTKTIWQSANLHNCMQLQIKQPWLDSQRGSKCGSLEKIKFNFFFNKATQKLNVK